MRLPVVATPRGAAPCAPVAVPLRRWLRRARGGAAAEAGDAGGPGSLPCGGACHYYELVRRMTLEERREIAVLFWPEVADGWVPTAADLLAALDIIRHRGSGTHPGPQE